VYHSVSMMHGESPWLQHCCFYVVYTTGKTVIKSNKLKSQPKPTAVIAGYNVRNVLPLHNTRKSTYSCELNTLRASITQYTSYNVDKESMYVGLFDKKKKLMSKNNTHCRKIHLYLCISISFYFLLFDLFLRYGHYIVLYIYI